MRAPQGGGSKVPPGSDRGLFGDFLFFPVGSVFDVVITVHGNIEQVSIRIHGAILGERPRRGPLGHRFIPFCEFLFDVVEILDMETEMIDSTWRSFAAVAQNREREIAV